MPHRIVRRVFPNGFTLLIQPLAHLPSVSLGLAVNVGSRDEAPSEAGYSHLLEHMLFQGTRRRDTRELSRVISAVGGQIDACTGRESTTFYAKVPAQQLPLAMDVIADMVRHSRLNTRDLEKEKNVILEELSMVEDTPDEWVHDLFSQALWPNHALGRPILGTLSSLRRARRKTASEYLKRQYRPERMILAVAGNVRPAQAEALARRYWEKYKTPAPAVLAPPQPLREPVQTHRQKPSLEQAHICLGVRGFPYRDPRRMAALAFSNILGGGPNSRLFYEIRERRALAYTVYSFLDFYRDTGVMGVYLACHPKKVTEAVEVVRREIRRLMEKPVTDQELRDTREQMRGGWLLSLESSSAHMWNLIQDETYLGKHPKPAGLMRSIQGIAKEQIRSVARDFFSQPLAAVFLGARARGQAPQFRISS